MPARLRLVCGLAVVLAMTRPTPSLAATGCGTLITNVAMVGMSSGFPSYVSYEMTYAMTAPVIVLCPPVVRCVKWVKPAVGGAGETLTFFLCVENQMPDTVWDVTMTDALPGNMTFDAMSPANYGQFLWGVVESSASVTAGPWDPGGPTVGQAPPWYLRWVVPGMRPSSSVCVTYSARIL